MDGDCAPRGQHSDNQRKRSGRFGEAAAQELLEREGYRIIDTNVRFGKHKGGLFGELDIVAWDGPALCFVEVKTRRGREMGAEELAPGAAVTPAKQRQIARLALAYANRYGLLSEDAGDEGVPLRFDVVAVILFTGRTDRVRTARLQRSAFLAPDDWEDQAFS